MFTTLGPFSTHLNDALLNLFRVPTQPVRKTLDLCWLTWQLDWLYSEHGLISAQNRESINTYWSTTPALNLLSDQVRFCWIKEMGFSWQQANKIQNTEHPAARLMHILDQFFTPPLSSAEKIVQFLSSFAGLPNEKANLVTNWISTSPKERIKSRWAPPRIAESYHWLTGEEITRILERNEIGTQLLETQKLNLIPLPETLPRPASFALPDESLWLAWPQKSRPTHLHPIVQASLVCHEAAHLLQSHETSGHENAEQETMWQSETAALTAEWSNLVELCSSQPEKMKNIFTRTWFDENHHHQLDIFWSDVENALSAPVRTNLLQMGQPISLPFLSIIYAILAADIFSEQ